MFKYANSAKLIYDIIERCPRSLIRYATSINV